MSREIRTDERNLKNLSLGLEMYRELEYKVSHCNTYEEAFEALSYDNNTDEESYTEENFDIENFNIKTKVYNNDGNPEISKTVTVYGAYGKKEICLYEDIDIDDIVETLESNGVGTQESTQGRSSKRKDDDWAYYTIQYKLI